MASIHFSKRILRIAPGKVEHHNQYIAMLCFSIGGSVSNRDFMGGALAADPVFGLHCRVE